MTQPFKGYELTLSKARRFPSQDKARQVWSSGAGYLEGMGGKVALFPACFAQYFPHWKEVKSIPDECPSLQRAALSSPLPSVEETPEKAKRHRPPPYLYTVGGNTSQSPLNTGRLCHLKSKALSGNMVVFYQQYAEKHLLFLQFFPLSDVYSSLKHHAPMRRVFSRTSKNHWFSRQYLGWSKNILPYYLRQILWLCIERVLMVCGGMFGVWSRVGGVGNKIYIIKKIMGIICSYRIAYVPPS